MEYTFLSATVLLILITDPLGNIPLFISCLRGVAPKRRTVVILREVAIAFAILFGAEPPRDRDEELRALLLAS